MFNLKAFVLAAATLAASSSGWAATEVSDPLLVQGSFSDKVLDTWVVTDTSSITGSIDWGTGTVDFSFGPFVFQTTLVDGTVTSVNLSSYVDQDSSSLGYHFDNVAAGTYQLLVSGSTTGLSIMQATTTITAVPEPDSWALMVAGLGAMGFIARRRVHR